MKKSFFAAVLASLLVCASCSPASSGNALSYERYVLSGMDQGIGVADRLPGMAETVAVLNAEPSDPSYVSCTAAGLFSEDDLVTLYQKEATKHVYPASMTKCMTALLTIENVPDLSEEILVTDDAYANLSPDSSLANLKVGGYYTVKDVLSGLLLPSGNEAANVLAIRVGGSVPEFVKMMNQRAAELGMINTHFMNPHGLHDPKHYTSVYDLYLLFRTLVSHDVFLEIAGAKKALVTCRMGEEKTTAELTNTNSFIREYVKPPEGISAVAGKTGYTASAGRCLVMLSLNSKGKRFITVIAHANTYDGVYEETVKLMELIPNE